MDGGGKTIKSLYECVPSIMALAQIGTELYHKVNEAFHKSVKQEHRSSIPR